MGLLRQLRDSEVGYYMGNHILICPIERSLNILTGIYEVYADELSITFNAKKRIFIVIKGRKCVEANANMYMCECR